MSLAIFENFLVFAERAVPAKGDLPTEIDAAEFENALVNLGVVLLHSHMEQCIKSAVEARCKRCVDPELLTFALKACDDKTGRIGIEALKGTLGRFSKAYQLVFKAELDQFGRAESWESIKNQRATVAHYGLPATCSLADLRSYYEDVRQILGFFCKALGLSQTEILAISSLITLGTPPPVPAQPTTS